MIFDALDAGIEPGGLRSRREIRLLVCFILANIDQPVRREHILTAAVEGAFANFFEISSAVADLLEAGNITEDEKGFLHITQESKESIDLLEADLPYTVREKSTALCAKLALREIYRKDNKAVITKSKRGYYVDCYMKAEDDDDILTFRLYSGTISQAELVRERFLDDPIAIYDNLIESMFPPKKNGDPKQS